MPHHSTTARFHAARGPAHTVFQIAKRYFFLTKSFHLERFNQHEVATGKPLPPAHKDQPPISKGHTHAPKQAERQCQRAGETRSKGLFQPPFGPFDNLVKPSGNVKKSQSVECQRVGDFAEMRVCEAAEASPENIASTRRENGQIV